MPLNTNIKIMYLNPAGYSSDNQMFADMAKTYKYPGTAVDIVSFNPATVPPKMTDLEFRSYEALIIADTVKAARQAAKDGYDAMVIGCFYDPALLDAREISGDTVIVGPCQASISQALTIANNFSIIIGEDKWFDQMRDTVYQYGYRDKLASFESVGLRVEDFQTNPERTASLMKSAGWRAYVERHAESIILGCTMEIGFYSELQQFLTEEAGGRNVPVIDCSIASLKAAEDAALRSQIGWTNSRAWGMEPPSEEELAKFEIFQDDYQFGNIIHVPADGTDCT
ncbi:MAG: aspartate/glutamate racemase family protein [Gammaproteobacteria bacterium]|nr:aspartate/glutamate racemase family protein [Gammaproteobacteria bacterium]MXW45740.1 hydantoin racemase [Gammaproteobacteria bacterium]MYD03104.1 hydantoin racemase [Gammaproteobacteria bacterium]MYI25727.1 hydantoin racemase [Gammaproteobacteria bacterium]